MSPQTPPSCPAPNVLQRLIHNELPVDEVDTLSTHLATCSECATTIESLERNATPPPESPTGTMFSDKHDLERLMGRIVVIT